MKILKSFLEISKYIAAGFIGVLLFHALDVRTDSISLSVLLVALIVLFTWLEKRVDVHKSDVEKVSTRRREQTKYDARVIEAAFALGVKCSIRSDADGVVKLWAADDPSIESALCSHYYVGEGPGAKAVEKAFALEMEAVNKFAARKTAGV